MENENQNEITNAIRNLPTREYISKTVEKALTEGMFQITQIKPANPIEFLGNYLLQKSQEKNNIN